MKSIFIYILFFIIPFGMFARVYDKTSLSGKIIDKETNESIPGAEIYFPDLKSGTISKNDGTYFIDNLPAIKVLVKVSIIGYSTITEMVDLSTVKMKDF